MDTVRISARLLGTALLLVLAVPTSIAASVVPLEAIVPDAPGLVTIGGVAHLFYELRVSNFAARPVTLRRVAVEDAGGHALATLEGSTLARAMSVPGDPEGRQDATIGAGQGATLFMDVALAGRPVPALVHRIEIVPSRAGVPDAARLLQLGATGTAPVEPVQLRAPLAGPGWLAANAPSTDSEHRRTIAVVDGRARISQRYAIDFVRLDAQGRAFAGDPGENAHWAGFGAHVYSTATGTVVEASDGLPDNTPGEPPAVPVSLDSIGGNHVVVDVGHGRHVYYGHLQAGSVAVRVGEHVDAGQRIGRVGNSGQSDAPHLHLHVADGPSALGANGLPWVLTGYDVEGRVPSLQILESPDGWKRPDAASPAAQRNSLPEPNVVIGFPGR